MPRLNRIDRWRTARAQRHARRVVELCPERHPHYVAVLRLGAQLQEALRLDIRLRP